MPKGKQQKIVTKIDSIIQVLGHGGNFFIVFVSIVWVFEFNNKEDVFTKVIYCFAKSKGTGVFSYAILRLCKRMLCDSQLNPKDLAIDSA